MSDQKCCRCDGTEKLRQIREVTIVLQEVGSEVPTPRSLKIDPGEPPTICATCMTEALDAALTAFKDATGLP